MTFNADPWATILAGSRKEGTMVTIKDYATLHRTKDRQGIANMIRLRFAERFLGPVLDSPKRHGFSIMAVGCLMVEALESFRNGWKDTTRVDGGGASIFRGFFNHHEEFRDLEPVADDFYKHVRCGILHQAETTGGWRIHRSSPFFAQHGEVRRLSASEFGKKLNTALDRYSNELATLDWRDPTWKATRRKLRQVCSNCGLAQAEVARLA